MRITLTFIVLLLKFFATQTFAQSTLTVNTSTTDSIPSCYLENTLYLDSNLISYGIGQGFDLGFIVTVFDTNCIAWDSLPYQSAIVQGQSSSNSFKFHQDDIVHLSELNDLLNQHIPNDHPFVIYTPIDYDGAAVASLSPQLAETLNNYWGSEAIQNQSIMILFGIKGHPNSFDIDTLSSGTQISYTTTICPHATQTVSLENLSGPSATIVATPNPSNNTITLSISEEYDYVEVLNLAGQCVKKCNVNDKQLQLSGFPAGTYFVVGSKGSERSNPVRIQFY